MEFKGVNLRSITPLLIYAGVSGLLFYSGLFAFLFAVPVQIAYTRKGRDYGIKTAITTGAFIVVIHLLQSFRFGAIGGETLRILFLDSLMPIGLLAGLSVFNLSRGYEWWIRLLVGAGIAILGSVPSLRLLQQAAEGDGALAEQLTAMLSMLGVQDNAEMWITMVQRIVFDSVGVGLTMAIAANWWIGRNIATRGMASYSVLRRAKVPDEGVWLVIAGLSVVVLAWIRTVPTWIEVIGWNVLLITAFFFAVQGIGILQYLIVRRGGGPLAERWVLSGTLILLFLPGINIVVSIGLPLFGMSELWIDYKRGESDESNSE